MLSVHEDMEKYIPNKLSILRDLNAPQQLQKQEEDKKKQQKNKLKLNLNILPIVLRAI